MKSQILALLLVSLISEGCSKKAGDSAWRLDLFNNEKIRVDFLATKTEFFTPPSTIVDFGYYIFKGSTSRSPSDQIAEWNYLQQAIFVQILRDAKLTSRDTLNGISLGESAKKVGITNVRAESLITERNLTSLEYLLATHEMRKKMAVELALMLSYRHLKEEGGRTGL